MCSAARIQLDKVYQQQHISTDDHSRKPQKRRCKRCWFSKWKITKFEVNFSGHHMLLYFNRWWWPCIFTNYLSHVYYLKYTELAFFEIQVWAPKQVYRLLNPCGYIYVLFLWCGRPSPQSNTIYRNNAKTEEQGAWIAKKKRLKSTKAFIEKFKTLWLSRLLRRI